MLKFCIKLEPYLRDVGKKFGLCQLIQTTNITTIKLYREQNDNNCTPKLTKRGTDIFNKCIYIISLNYIHPLKRSQFHSL